MSSTAITIYLFIEDITSSNNPVQCCLVSCPSSIVFIRNNAAALSEGLIEAPLVLLLSGSINPHACKGKGIWLLEEVMSSIKRQIVIAVDDIGA